MGTISSKLKLFPQSNIRNIALFYVLTAVNNAWFIEGNWIFFWTRFMTYGQLGWIDATAFAFGLLMEIPSGAVADIIGKKKTVVTAMGLSAVGALMMAAANSMEMLWVAFFIVQLGWALYSGAAEALAYDTLVDHHQEVEYQRVAAATVTVAQIAMIAAILVGGLLYVIHYRLSHLAWGLTYLIGFILSWRLIEPKTDTEKFSFTTYRQQLIDGTKQLFSPALKPYLLVILTVLGFDYLYNWGLVRPVIATNFGFLDKEQAIILALFGVVSAITVRSIPTLRKMISDKKGLFILAGIMASGFWLAYFPLGYWGVIAMFLITISGALAYPWVSIVVNKEISSKYRATTLSTVALITKMPYVLLAIVAGKMAESGTFNLFALGISVVSVMAMLVSGYEKLRQSYLSRRNLPPTLQ